jgi:rubrerythrin
MENEDVCYTREVALEKAIEMEKKSFEAYKDAYLRIIEPHIKSLVKELALEELEHKHVLEKAYFEETVLMHEEGLSEGPSMKLALFLKETPLGDDADDHDVMVHAIHDKKRIVDFYQKMTSQCAGAPMEKMFKKLSAEEENHLARLEEMYEGIYMKDN